MIIAAFRVFPPRQPVGSASPVTGGALVCAFDGEALGGPVGPWPSTTIAITRAASTAAPIASHGQMRRGRFASALIVVSYPKKARIAPTITDKAARTPSEIPAHMACVRASLYAAGFPLLEAPAI